MLTNGRLHKYINYGANETSDSVVTADQQSVAQSIIGGHHPAVQREPASAVVDSAAGNGGGKQTAVVGESDSAPVLEEGVVASPTSLAPSGEASRSTDGHTSGQDPKLFPGVFSRGRTGSSQ